MLLVVSITIFSVLIHHNHFLIAVVILILILITTTTTTANNNTTAIFIATTTVAGRKRRVPYVLLDLQLRSLRSFEEGETEILDSGGPFSRGDRPALTRAPLARGPRSAS